MSDKKQTVAILIPIYKDELNNDELSSLSQCISILHKYPLVFFGPKKLQTDVYKKVCDQRIPFNMEYFDEVYFNNVAGYNLIMLNQDFYRRFLSYKYILIYQLDAWIFKDDLLNWCNKNYDYIGAPWVNWESSKFVAEHATVLRTILSRLGYKKFNLVGNGGLSLRKVKSCLYNLKILKNKAADFEMNEDYFFSFMITSYNPFFRIPSFKEALKFSFDENPEESFNLNNHTLPMGCHAWPKYKDFWYQYLKTNISR